MSSKNQTILVTGGAGYIGSHAALALKNAGYEVIILDNLSYGHQEIVDEVLQLKLSSWRYERSRFIRSIVYYSSN